MAEILGNFEQAVLVTILRLGDGAYGRAILNDARVRLNREIAAGAIYATLDRLESKGLISSHLGAGTAVRAGRPRRYYVVEDIGIRALNESRLSIETIRKGASFKIGVASFIGATVGLFDGLTARVTRWLSAAPRDLVESELGEPHFCKNAVGTNQSDKPIPVRDESLPGDYTGLTLARGSSRTSINTFR
jgi:DNA-binding PadR family transcriptional regulator